MEMGDKKEKREDLPKLDVPKDYEPLTNVSVDIGMNDIFGILKMKNR